MVKLKTAEQRRRLERSQIVPTVRYGITCIFPDGYRKLAMPAQARHLWDTPAEAEAWLSAMLEDISNVSRLNQIHGPQSEGTFTVSPFNCWPHGDPMGCYPLEHADG